MNAALELDDVMRLGQGSLNHLAEIGERLNPQDEAARARFAREVVAVEAIIKQTWQLVALLARRAPSCEETAQIWKTMRDFTDTALAALSRLREAYPTCGTPALHDLALDYRAAAEQRYQQNLEATLCQQTTLPEGLLPPMTSRA